MKNHKDFFKDFDNLKTELRNSISQYHNKFDVIRFDRNNQSKINFLDNEFGCFEKNLSIRKIINEGGNIGIYPNSKKYLSHSENTIEDVHDLMCILSILESTVKL